MTSTAGEDLDADGYTVTIGSDSRAIAINAQVTYTGLTVASHGVTLSGLADNCSVAGNNPRTVAVTAGGSSQTTFQVSCTVVPVPALERIVFVSERTGFKEIHSMNPDGSDIVQLTDLDADSHSPVWSPDGARIAFRSDAAGDDDIYVMAADGSDIVRLTQSSAYEGSPSWSPDGTRLAFGSERDGNGNDEIDIIAVDGTGLVRVTNHPDDDEQPSWKAGS